MASTRPALPPTCDRFRRDAALLFLNLFKSALLCQIKLNAFALRR